MKIIDLSVDLYNGMTKFRGDYHVPFSSEITGIYEVDRTKLLSLPLKLQGADGAPARMLAIIEQGGFVK